MKRIIIEIPEDWDGYLGGNPYPKTYSYKSYADPCENCPNNPANNPHASGFCNCALPYMTTTTFNGGITGWSHGTLTNCNWGTYDENENIEEKF